MHKIIATGLGIGYVRKGGGSIAALVVAVVLYLVGSEHQLAVYIATACVIVTGVWSATRVEELWGIDNKRVVIDEIAGMLVSVLFLPVTIPTLAAAFGLFRFFDIVKPLYIRRLEKLPKGWGVMADDVAAGLYTNVLLHVIVLFHPSLL